MGDTGCGYGRRTQLGRRLEEDVDIHNWERQSEEEEHSKKWGMIGRGQW